MRPDRRSGALSGIRIGITGGIGCGKSTAGEALEAEGVSVLDTDRVARALLIPGTGVYQALVGMFGDAVVQPDTEIHRAWLARRMFEDPEIRRKVEAVMHPVIRDEVAQWLARQDGPSAVIVPLLFEAGYEDLFTVTLCVAVEDVVALDRCEARGMDRGDAVRRQAAQWPLAKKMKHADRTLWNRGSRDAFRAEVRRWYREFVQEGEQP